jgi:murein DD-endopeptidase MepM/ murein hydrolase activator NlpD
MNDRDEASFDPKTWLSAPAETTRRPGADDASFDIRSWAGDTTPPPPPPPAPKPARAPIDPLLRTRLAALGAGTALALLGGVAAYASREERPKPAPAAMPSEPAAFTSRRTLVLASAAEIEPTLRASGILAAEATEAGRQALAALGTTPGEIRLIFDMRSDGSAAHLDSLEATRNDGAGLVLRRTPQGFATKTLAAALETRLTVVRGEIDSNSFYSSAVSAGVTDSLISDFANAFSFDFDMQREVAPGDIFEVAFEQAHNPAGEAVGVPRLVYVSLRTDEKSRALYRFTPPGEREAGWFDGNGFSTVRALMRTPVDSARISSQFGYRTHPILGYQKLHRGTDFAAPTGTPIYASGSATVDFAGMKGANGNFVRLRHDNGWQTLYLHMNRILSGIEPGVHVAQGQQIGEIGTTGRSTGPHLHYEVHIDGQPVDPLTIETGTGQSLSGKALAAFRKERDRVDQQRAATAD